MITMDAFIADFGAAVGIPDFRLDAEGAGRLALGEHIIDILGDRRDGRLLLSCLVGELPDRGRDAAMARLLDANCMLRGTDGATLGVPAGSGAVILAQAVDIRHASAASFAQAIADFGGVAERVQPLLQPGDAAPESAAAVSEGASATDALTMIRI